MKIPVGAYESYFGKDVIALFSNNGIRYQVTGKLETVSEGECKFTNGKVHEMHPRNGDHRAASDRPFFDDNIIYSPISFERGWLVTMGCDPNKK